MPTIHQLSPSVVNKIAAGEVIERPASVVKELLENSVDAGATRIDVALDKGGSEMIRVADNGCGIATDELPLAVASHATSKIQSADDLFSVVTLGFRGEALASIASVSRLRLRSRQAGSPTGYEVEVAGADPRAVQPCGCPPGTQVEVRQLFLSTPVRRKFLRTTQTEMGHATEAFTRLALAYPDVHFTLRHHDRPVYDLPPTTDLQERIAYFFGGELADTLINGVLLTQPKNWATSLSATTLTAARTGSGEYRVVRKRAELLRPDPDVADRRFMDALRWEHERTVAYGNARIGRATQALSARDARVRDSPIIGFVNEVQRRVSGADLSATAAFQIDAELLAGDISIAHIAKLYPYDNTLKAIRITGAQLRAYLDALPAPAPNSTTKHSGQRGRPSRRVPARNGNGNRG